jgi:hypothetical protein
LATDTRIAREDDNDPSDEMDIKLTQVRKTTEIAKKKEKKLNKRKKGPTK